MDTGVKWSVNTQSLDYWGDKYLLMDALNRYELAYWFNDEKAAYTKAIEFAQMAPCNYAKLTKWQDGEPVGIPMFFVSGYMERGVTFATEEPDKI